MAKNDGVSAWLEQKARKQAKLYFLGAAALLPAGIVVLLITYLVICFVLWLAFSWLLPHLVLVGLVALGVVALLFRGNAVTDPEYLDELRFNQVPGGRITVTVARATGGSWLMAFTGADSAHTFIKPIVTFLFQGPRILTLAWRMFRKGRRLQSIDVAACAKVLVLLLNSGRRIAFDDILLRRPEIDPLLVFPQLRDIDGVLFLSTEPQGLTIAPHLVDEISDWRANRRLKADQAAESDAVWDEEAANNPAG